MAVTYRQELLDRAEAYQAQPLAARRYDEGLTELTSLYAAITGQPVGKCRQCQYSDYVAVVQAYIRQATRFLHPETMAESKYSIAPGLENEVFVHEGLSEAITAENLTDQSAEFLIKHGFAHAFVLKSGEKASTEGAKPTQVVSENPLVPEADLKAEQEAHTASKTKAAETLKVEKDAHKATKDALKAEKQQTATLTKERDELNRQLTEANEKLAQTATAAEPAAAPVVDPATQA